MKTFHYYFSYIGLGFRDHVLIPDEFHPFALKNYNLRKSRENEKLQQAIKPQETEKDFCKFMTLPRYESPSYWDVITSVGAMTKVGRQADRDTRLKLNSRQTGRQADSLASISICYYVSILFIFSFLTS